MNLSPDFKLWNEVFIVTYLMQFLFLVYVLIKVQLGSVTFYVVLNSAFCNVVNLRYRLGNIYLAR